MVTGRDNPKWESADYPCRAWPSHQGLSFCATDVLHPSLNPSSNIFHFIHILIFIEFEMTINQTQSEASLEELGKGIDRYWFQSSM